MSSHSGKAAQARGTLVGQQGRVGQVFVLTKIQGQLTKKTVFVFRRAIRI